MSLKFFHEPCNFHKNFIYVIRTLSLILLWKISFLAQKVHLSEILRHFSQFYPNHSRLVYDPTGTILAILYGEVPHMLPAKYQPNPPGGSGEEDFWRVFTIFGHGGHLEFRIKTILTIFLSPSAWMLHMKFGYIWPSGFRGEVVWKCGRTTDDGRTTEASHTISSPGAFGSGELKMQENGISWKNSLKIFLIDGACSYILFSTINIVCYRIRQENTCSPFRFPAKQCLISQNIPKSFQI